MDAPFWKRLVWINGGVPLALLTWDALRGDLGANPVNFAIRTTGILSLAFLVLTMAVTPTLWLTRWNRLGPMRRVFGLYAFYYAAIHFSLFVFFDRMGNPWDVLSEITHRTYLLVGSVGLAIMVPLAVTSTDRMIRWMGPKRWKWLHRSAYVAAAAGTLHFFLLVKADTTRPLLYGGALLGLFAARLTYHYLPWRPSTRPVSNPTVIRPNFWSGPLRVGRIFSETPEVKTFRLVSEKQGEMPFSFQPGQYLNLTLTIDGKAVRRSYTISSSPAQSAHCEITVKREENGLVSRYLHDQTRVGDVLKVSAPAGRFIFTGVEAKRIVLIGGGVGITPLMSKIRWLGETAWPGTIRLIHSIRTPAEFVFRNELEEFQRRFSNFRMTVTATRATGSDWKGEKGRIDAAMLKRLIPPDDDGDTTVFHLCGPTEMTQPLIEILKGMGIPSERIHSEAFASPSGKESASPMATVAQPSGEQSITFARSKRTETTRPGQTILELAESGGISLGYDCRAGICGQCKTRLLEGEVSMEVEDALSQADKEKGIILACQARPITDLVVDA